MSAHNFSEAAKKIIRDYKSRPALYAQDIDIEYADFRFLSALREIALHSEDGDLKIFAIYAIRYIGFQKYAIKESKGILDFLIKLKEKTSTKDVRLRVLWAILDLFRYAIANSCIDEIRSYNPAKFYKEALELGMPDYDKKVVTGIFGEYFEKFSKEFLENEVKK